MSGCWSLTATLCSTVSPPTNSSLNSQDLGHCTNRCNWIHDFLISWPWLVQIINIILTTTDASQGCVPQASALPSYTNDYVAKHHSKYIHKFADYTSWLNHGWWWICIEERERAPDQVSRRLTGSATSNSWTVTSWMTCPMPSILI